VGHRDCAGPIGQRHGLLVLRRVDGIERPAMRREHVGEGFGEVGVPGAIVRKCTVRVAPGTL
jgi:hypothetical protein